MAEPAAFRLDDLVVDLRAQCVKRDGLPVEVSGLSFQMLAYLIRQGDRVISFDELIASIWAPAVVNEETVTQRVKLLRQALGDDGRSSRYLRSIRGRGYQLCSRPVAITAEANPGRRRAIAAVAISLVLASAFAWLLWDWNQAQPSPPAAKDAAVTPDIVQRARYYAGIGQRENNERAIALFEQALSERPDDVGIRIGLSFAYSARVCLYDYPPEHARRAETLANDVIVQVRGNAAAHAALGYALDCQGRINDALAAYETATRLDPAGRHDSLASAAHLYAIKGRLADALEANVRVLPDGDRLRFLDLQIARTLELLGFTTAAEWRYERGFRLYPDNVFGNVAWPRCLFLQGRFADANAALAQAMARPKHPELFVLAGELALLRGDSGMAARAFAEAAALRPHAGWPHTLALLYGEREADAAEVKARIAAVRTAIDSGDRWPDNWLEIALLHDRLSDRESALIAIAAAVDAGFSDRNYLLVSPLFRDIKREPAFAEQIDRVSRRIAHERDRVLKAAWLPPDLLKTEPAASPAE